jgi:hypothetical protein
MVQLRKTAFAAIALFVLALFAGTARADSFGIALTGNAGSPSGTGFFTTNGCATCSDLIPGQILSFFVSLGSDTGAKVFDLADDASIVMFNRATGSLAGSMDLNSETLDLLTFTTGTSWTLLSGTNLYSGRYTISALFEPSALASLAIMILGLVGWRAWARWRLSR